MDRLRQLDKKTWLIEGAQLDDVMRAAKESSQRFAPIDEGPLPFPMRMALKTMVAMQTYDTYDEAHSRGSKTHLLGPSVYRTTVQLTPTREGVVVHRESEGLLAPFADLTNLGRAVYKRLRRP